MPRLKLTMLSAGVPPAKHRRCNCRTDRRAEVTPSRPMRSHDAQRRCKHGLTKCHAHTQITGPDEHDGHSRPSAPGALREGHRNTNATRSTPALLSARGAAARGRRDHRDSAPIASHRIALRKVLSRTIEVDGLHRLAELQEPCGALLRTDHRSRSLDKSTIDTRSLQDKYEAMLRKAPASRTLEELQLLVGWAKQIEFKDEEVKKAVKLEQLCRAMRLQDTELDELVCKQGDEVRDAILPPSHLARVRPLVALLVSS